MSTYTTNYNLEKPDLGDDFKDFRSNYNSNMDIIDANLGGGGGGNVDDVLVNGVSVVDGNHDAQITSYKEVTQAEYDALPATKLTDGIAYFIKDAGGGGGGSSSHNYSTTEQVIGTWIDGKPLYECTWEFENAITANSNSWTDTPISNATIKGIIGVKGYNINADKINCWNALSATADSGAVVKIIQNRTAQIVIKYLTLQYTKTTDV